MLYYLHQFSEFREYLGGLNVFQYQTFRAVAAALTSFVLTLMFGNLVIRKLISLKIGQPIRTKEEVHRLHELHGAKAGTPTMGGVLILGAVGVTALLWARLDNPFVWAAVLSMVYLGGLGFADDYLKVTKKKSAGISSRTKLIAQVALGAMLGVFFLTHPQLKTQAQEVYVPFLKEPLLTGIGALVVLFYAIIIAGASNAVNLTDGLDGLATGCTVSVAFTYSILTYVGGNSKIASYLQIPFNVYTGELSVVCMALVGAAMGFLWFNCHPARVFMGDTGSLAIGGLLAVVAICCKQEVLLVLVGGIFVLEALSVILQVLSFKLTGRRIFAMSPIHHHFELKGWKENTVIVRFWILSMIFALLGLATLKLR